jgi:hypothetical protein
MDETKRQELRLNARAVLHMANDRGWGEMDLTRLLANLALEAVEALKEQQAEVERLRAANQRLESYLNQIAGSAQEWDCNKLGGVNIQRKRWQRLGELARTALRR